MGKALVIAVSLIVGVFAFISAASISSGGSVAYAERTEEAQQQYLDNMAKGFTTGFKFTAGKRAEVTDIFTDAEYDMISISVKYLGEDAENASQIQIEKMRRYMEKSVCKMADKQKMLANGITFRVRMFRPSGTKMGTVQVDQENCVQYIA